VGTATVWGGVGVGEGEYRFNTCRSKIRTVFSNRITSSYFGAGDNDCRFGRTGASDIIGRVCPIYKLHGDVPHHKRASTFHAFGDGSDTPRPSWSDAALGADAGEECDAPRAGAAHHRERRECSDRRELGQGAGEPHTGDEGGSAVHPVK
jgi:hypothetical protein